MPISAHVNDCYRALKETYIFRIRLTRWRLSIWHFMLSERVLMFWLSNPLIPVPWRSASKVSDMQIWRHSLPIFPTRIATLTLCKESNSATHYPWTWLPKRRDFTRLLGFWGLLWDTSNIGFQIQIIPLRPSLTPRPPVLLADVLRQLARCDWARIRDKTASL